MTAKIRNLPKRSIILYIWQQAKDKQGKLLQTEDVLSLIARSASVPIYGLASWEVGAGVVGGYVRTLDANGARAGAVALQIANGARAQDIPVESLPIDPVFDWRELKRWGVSEANLPPGSIVRFREPSFWDRYKWYATAVVSVFIVQSLLIVGLVINHTLRKRAQAEVAESQARLAGIVGSAMDAIISVDQDQRVVLFNDAAQKMFLCTEHEATGQPLDRFIPEQLRGVHDRHVRDFGKSALTKKHMGSSQAIYGRRMDGDEFQIESSISQLELYGRKFYTVILRDITRRKRAEEALRAVQESLTIALDASQMGTWDLDLTR
ncbi:MAG: PAS domain S-box protein, partial [Blastocatellia bacterium]